MLRNRQNLYYSHNIRNFSSFIKFFAEIGVRLDWAGNFFFFFLARPGADPAKDLHAVVIQQGDVATDAGAA